ncbi:DUF222 domain-containing protein [Pseudonocardia nematodicida]|uniref:DUF222 domain-containing protein n=2 Tax=Pseudonocardia nematodicida TaxID=1206997 RepID=A0ABV1KJV4_9PSEU
MSDVGGPLLAVELCAHGWPPSVCRELCDQLDDPDEPWGLATLPDTPVGPGLALQVQTAAAAPQLCTDTELLALAESAARLRESFAAITMRMVGVFTARYPRGSSAAPPDADPRAVCPVSRWLPDQISLVFSISREEALSLIGRARRFTDVLPATLAAWEAGRIDERRADQISHATTVLSDDLAREVEAAVLPGAGEATRRQLSDRIRRAIARLDPDGAQRRHAVAKADRRMSISRGEEGMGSLWISGTAEQTEASWRCVDRMARSLGTQDTRTLDQRRVDIAHHLLQGTMSVTDLGAVESAVASVLAAAQGTPVPPDAADHSGGDDGTHTTAQPDTRPGAHGTNGQDTTGQARQSETGTAPAAPAAIVSREVIAAAVAQALATKPDPNTVIGRKPLIQVVVGLDTLLGSERPAELAGHGPIPAVTARALAAGGTLARIVTDPVTGQCLDYGRSTYAPPANLDDHVRARDGHCRGALCTRDIRELDHHIPFGGGHHGHTSAENLHGFCTGTHKLKDAPGWHAISLPDGGLEWISPCGWTRTTYPKDYTPFTDPLPQPPAAPAAPPDETPADPGEVVADPDMPPPF